MKNLIGVIILAVVCVGLAVALLTTKKRAATDKQKDTDTILTLSNQWVETSSKLDEQKQVNLSLEQVVAARRTELVQMTNQFTEVTTTLRKTEDALKLTQEEVVRREAKIAELEQQNASLDARAAELSARAAELTTAITNLTIQIDDTKQKLAASEGDKAFLERELKRLMGEKADLERQFNDLVVLRAQVAKLREELNIARRLEWIRKGLFAVDETKGAQRLLQRGPSAPEPPKPAGNYDLNVEVNADGSVRVIPPLTNAPATAPK